MGPQLRGFWCLVAKKNKITNYRFPDGGQVTIGKSEMNSSKPRNMAKTWVLSCDQLGGDVGLKVSIAA
jgi:hypothetical protein